MQIKRAVESIPGGMMVVPLATGALIATFAPHTATFFGSFTGALFTGAIPIIAVFFVCLGGTLPVRSLPTVLRRGGTLLAGKIVLGILTGVLLGHFLGERPVMHGWFAGISTLAVVAAINDTNGGLYLALMQQYGDAEGAGSYSLMSLETGPFLTMITLGIAGLSAFPWPTLMGGILPLAVGLVLGNLDLEIRDLLGRAMPALVPFFAFALGATLNLHHVWQAGLLGIALGFGVLTVSGIVLFSIDRLAGGNGVAGSGRGIDRGKCGGGAGNRGSGKSRVRRGGGSGYRSGGGERGGDGTFHSPRHGMVGFAQEQGEVYRILIVADDLSGAADCGIACAAHNLNTVVVLDDRGATPKADVLVIDANTRGLAPDSAAAETARIVRAHAASSGQVLFKKLDSSMRGNIGVELAAALGVRQNLGNRSVIAMAPAFPAVGRTTVGGWQHVNGEPAADVCEMLSSAGLRTVTIGLDRIRTGASKLLALMSDHAAEYDAVVCDAETDEDLLAIAEATAGLKSDPVWAGSAGLARHLPRALGFAKSTSIQCTVSPVRGSILTVVGSMAGISREQAAVLGSAPDLLVQTFPSEISELEAALTRGRDVMILLAGNHCAQLGGFLAPYAQQVGGLILTGGETARAVLSAFGVTGLRLIRELEPGVPLSLTEGFGPLPVITKAGTFGNRDTLVRCRVALREGTAG